MEAIAELTSGPCPDRVIGVDTFKPAKGPMKSAPTSNRRHRPCRSSKQR